MDRRSIEKSDGVAQAQILKAFTTPHLVEVAGLHDADPWCVEGSMALSRIARLWEQTLESVLKPHGLIPAEMRVLSSLIAREGEALTMSEIKRSVAVTAGGVTKAVARLETLGFVARHASALDGRVIHVVATDKGRSHTRKALNDVVTHFEQLFDDCDAGDRRAVSLSLGIIAKRLEAFS